jgi:hypothetical protein
VQQLLGREVVVEVRVLGEEAEPLPDGDVPDRPAQDLGVTGVG